MITIDPIKMQKDKLLHILISLIITAILIKFLPIWLSVLIAFCIGVTKEIYDKVTGKGCFEWLDIICDCIGILIGVL